MSVSDFITVKGFVDFTYLYDEQRNEYHLVNGHSLFGYRDYGYYLIYPLQNDWWKCIRKIIITTEKKLGS